jgi:hypothetical protein
LIDFSYLPKRGSKTKEHTYMLPSEEKFEDTKGIIRIRISKKKPDNKMAKRKSTIGQTTIYKTYI